YHSAVCMLEAMDMAGVVSFFFQAEDGIRDFHVTGVQTCALPIFFQYRVDCMPLAVAQYAIKARFAPRVTSNAAQLINLQDDDIKIGRASCRERGVIWLVAGPFMQNAQG